MLRPLLVPVVFGCFVVAAHGAPAQGTTRVSVDSGGAQANGPSYQPDLSADGRIVAFSSDARNLVNNDGNQAIDCFTHLRTTGRTARVSIKAMGGEGNGWSGGAHLSSAGRYVACYSDASDLVAGDTNGKTDVFLRDRTENRIVRVSVPAGGQQANGHSHSPRISADGNLVVFVSEATNLVANDTNDRDDVFVRDLQNGTTTRVSVASNGTAGNGHSQEPSISGDGKRVVFNSFATNLVANDTNGKRDVFLRDLAAGTTRRVSVSTNGVEADGHSTTSAINLNGSWIVFVSEAANLVANDTNGKSDVFAHELATGRTRRVNLGAGGQQADGATYGDVDISNNGRYVLFSSFATNLVAGDTNGEADIFVHDRQTDTLKRASLTSTGGQANGICTQCAISPDGTVVAFVSAGTNLVPNDTNQRQDVFVASNPFTAAPATAAPWEGVLFRYGDGLLPLPPIVIPVRATAIAGG